ncbi:MAG: hypothetical protein AAFZ89_10010 [Bacteroidota bacterium]
MKITKISLVLFAAFIALFISCDVSSDDDATELPNFDVLGLYDLVEVNVNPALDLNEDGTASTNMVDELDCLSGTLLIDGDLVWTLSQVDLVVNTIPIGELLFVIDCADTTAVSGTWFSDETEVTFSGDPALSTLEILDNGDRLINTVGEDLPGFMSFVYERRIVN